MTDRNESSPQDSSRDVQTGADAAIPPAIVQPPEGSLSTESAGAAELQSTRPQSDSHSASPVSMLGRYRVVGELGRGGFGTVYLGHDDLLDRPVAIKVLRPDIARTMSAETLLSEARTVAGLRHPGIAEVHDAGTTTQGQLFVVSRFVNGSALSHRLRRERLDWQTAADIVRQTAVILAIAHKHMITHRDIKPGNLMIEPDGRVTIIDFGLAIADQQASTRVEYSGTPAYMSPEQAAGRSARVDGRSDIFSLGSVFYEMLTGVRPFEGTSYAATLGLIQAAAPRPPSQIVAGLPEELERICLRCLRRNVDERYANASRLAEDLDALLHTSRWNNIPWKLIVPAGVAVAFLASLPLFFSNRGSPESSTIVPPPAATTDDSAYRTREELLAVMRSLLDERSIADDRRIAGLDIRTAEATRAPEDTVDSAAPVPRDDSQTNAADSAATDTSISLPAGMESLEAELRAAAARGDRDKQYSLLLEASNTLVDERHYSLAEKISRQMVALSQGDASKYPIACGQLGLALYKQENFTEANDVLRESLAAYQKLYDVVMAAPDSPAVTGFRSQMARMLAVTHLRLGNSRKFAHEYEAATQEYEAATAICEKHDRKAESLTVLMCQGGMESEQGHHTAAIALLERGLALATELNASDDAIAIRINLANAWSRSGNDEKANAMYGELDALIADTGSYETRSTLLLNWATSLMGLGRSEEAREKLLQLRTIVRPGDREAEAALQLLDHLEHDPV